MHHKIALAGNPNSGKTTMFNDLTGSNQYVGNWPGVTVEKKEGRLKGDPDTVIMDLPGIYSLSPYTLEEVVTRNYLLNDEPDAILNIVDASNLERNLYLTTQLMELGLPLVIALNMMDVVRKAGDEIDTEKLAAALGCEIIETAATKREGSLEAVRRAAALGKTAEPAEHPHVFGGTAEHALAHIEDLLSDRVPPKQLRWYAIKLFERDEKVMEQLALPGETLEKIKKVVAGCEREMDDDAESIIINERYAYITRLMKGCLRKKALKNNMSVSDRIDRVVTSRVLALPIFIAVMFIVYFVSVTTVGAIVTDFMNDTLFGGWIAGALGEWLSAIGTAGWLSSLLIDGIVGGVGAVLGFVPQMLILFLFLAILEDVGYMARVAFIMDKIFRKFGLSGKSFIPMLIGSGCSVPGIMASRTIESERDRRMTVMTTSLIPCGAKMPIVALIAGAVLGGAWWVAPAAYFIGVAAVIVSGIILKKTKMFRGEPSPFVMELPAYHVPSATNVLRSTWERSWSFIKRAGTVILLASIAIWFFSSFGFTGGFGMVKNINDSILAAIGKAIAWLFVPLGFGSWQAAVATLMGLLAKEEVVGALGTMTRVADSALGSQAGLTALFPTVAAGFSFLLFNLLNAPCFAAMGAIRHEMKSARWTWFAIGYLSAFAYAVALMVYQLSQWFAGAGFTLWTGVALALLALFGFLLLRKPRRDGSTRSMPAQRKESRL